MAKTKKVKKVNNSRKKKTETKAELKFKSTIEIETHKKIVDQVIGQEHAVNVIKKAAQQRRHVLLIGEPGTGKSMLGLAMAELLPKEKLVDILSFPNPNSENEPLIRTVQAGQGRDIVLKNKMQSAQSSKTQSIIILVLAVLAMVAPWFIREKYNSDIMFAAFFLGGIGFLVAAVLFINMGKRAMSGKTTVTPRLIVDNRDKKIAPFMDASGAHAGALLGDVLHDPFQSGGLGTPAHERVVAGMIHKAHNGVLFVDEIATLAIPTQQELLTAIQEGKFSITGQSERSAGAMVRTEPVPCHFVMIAAGNLDTVEHMHPALRSRIRGYGYEVYMKDTMPDTAENRNKIYQFISQEVRKDGKIPHFTYDAAQRVLQIARKKANRKGHLTLKLRELGGVVRAAGDLAFERKLNIVSLNEVNEALTYAKSLENQLVSHSLEREKDYEIIHTKGNIIGRVNGLAVAGDAGIVLPIEAAATPGGKEPKIIATGGLKEIAQESVLNVSAVIKKYFGENIKDKYDIYVQFLQQHNIEGDSASIAMATTIISAITEVPIKQNYAMTGSIAVGGEVLAVGGVTYKVEAAIKAGLTHVFIPHSNAGDIIIQKEELKKIKVIPVKNITQVWEKVFEWKGHAKTKKKLLGK